MRDNSVNAAQSILEARTGQADTLALCLQWLTMLDLVWQATSSMQLGSFYPFLG